MSRGLGDLQRAVLQTARSGRDVSEGRLCWDTATRLDRTTSGGIPTSFYSSFRRALVSVTRRRMLIVERRYLASLEEVAAEYPFSSNDLRMRRARQELLPILSSFAASRGRRFSVAQTEERVLERTRSSATTSDTLKSQWAEAVRTWKRLERAAFTLLRTELSDADRDLVFDTVTKGRQYFGSGGYSVNRPLRELLTAMVTSPVKAVADHGRAVKALADEWLPELPSVRENLKAWIYIFADFRQGVAQSIRQDAVDHLVQGHREVLERHFKIVGRAKSGFLQRPTVVGLDSLITRDVLRLFKFVRPANGRALRTRSSLGGATA